TIGTIPLEAFPVPEGMTLAEIKSTCEKSTRTRGGDIHARKGYTSYGPAAAACRLVRSILGDDGRIFTVSARAAHGYGVGERVVLGVPCALGRDGIVRQLVLRRSDEEQRLLEKSAAVLEAAYCSIG